MRRKKVIVPAVVVAAGLIAVLHVMRSQDEKNGRLYQLAEVTRGDLESTVSSTGTLSTVGTVDVGAQVSGTIDTVYVDYNDKVTRGQVLAVLDTDLFEESVTDAEATVKKYRAQVRQAEAEYERNRPLYEKGYLSETEFITVETALDAARASLTSAEAALKRAQTNLRYCIINSPIDGMVIERNIEAGQTIAADFQTPTLFIIAEDLSKMKIEVNVDESDIGSIRENQTARFTVQAYPDEVFTGTVRQVRLKPETIQNVVNYTVIVDASNERELLLPGMTATVDFIVEQRRDVILVPNAAIQFQSDADMLQEVREHIRKKLLAGRSGGRLPGDGERGGPVSASALPGIPPTRVFYIDETGSPSVAFFSAGTTDGVTTEVTGNSVLKAGMQVITGTNGQQGQKDTERFSLFPRPPEQRGPPM